MRTTGEKLKAVRLSLGLTQLEIAEIMKIGQRLLSAIESDKRKLRDKPFGVN